MHFTDTHTHLFSEEFETDIDQVIQKSIEAGVNKFYLPNINSKTIAPMMDLCEKYPNNCFPMMGLHPSYVKDDFEEELTLVEEWHSKQSFVAVGEIGIDLYWDKTYLKQQQEAFRRQINLAKKLHLPIIIHVRDSFNEVFEIIDELNDDTLFGIFHCFTGTYDQAMKIIGYGGFKLGVGGVITFKNSGLDKVISKVELEHLVLETDSPYLTPAPFRGKRNESSFLPLIAQKLADVKQVAIEKVAKITNKNANQVFYGR